MKKDISLSEGFRLMHYLKAFLAAFSCTVIVFALLSALFAHTDIPENVWELILSASGAFSSFLAAFFSAIGTRKRGFLTGIISSLLYTLLLILPGMVFFPGKRAAAALIKKLLYAVLFGMIGGILGINFKVKKVNS